MNETTEQAIRQLSAIDLHQEHEERPQRRAIFSNLLENVFHESEWDSQRRNESFYYHYTSIQNAHQILRQRLIHASKARLKRFGRGVFMTVLKPNESTFELLSNNYRGNEKFIRKTECAFAISRSVLSPSKLAEPSRDIWRNDAPIDLTTTPYFIVLRGQSHL